MGQEQPACFRKEREFEYTRRDFEYLRRISFEHSGIVVGDDKFDMFYARLSRRVRVLGLADFQQYCEVIADRANGEFAEFINAITTNLTSFFREAHHFDFLRQQLLPRLLQARASERRVRIWSAGCSTGEEPYSIAMQMAESIPSIENWDVKILATDLDSNVLETARRGVYSEESLGNVDVTRLHRWFHRGTGSRAGLVRVKESLGAMIRFRQLNLMEAWPLQGQFDAIFCRNVIIYFDKETTRRLVNRFADLLAPGGYLVIGHSESLHGISRRLEPIGNTIYRRTGEEQFQGSGIQPAPGLNNRP